MVEGLSENVVVFNLNHFTFTFGLCAVNFNHLESDGAFRQKGSKGAARSKD